MPSTVIGIFHKPSSPFSKIKAQAKLFLCLGRNHFRGTTQIDAYASTLRTLDTLRLCNRLGSRRLLLTRHPVRSIALISPFTNPSAAAISLSAALFEFPMIATTLNHRFSIKPSVAVRFICCDYDTTQALVCQVFFSQKRIFVAFLQ